MSEGASHQAAQRREDVDLERALAALPDGETSYRTSIETAGEGAVPPPRDIDEALRTATRQAEQDRARMRDTLDSLLYPHVILEAVRDENQRIVDFVFSDANPAACEFNRLRRDELIGTRLLGLHPAAGTTELFDMYVKVVETGEPLDLEDWPYPQDLLGGEVRRYDVRAARVGDGLSQTWRDVTERGQAAEALRDSNERFMVAARANHSMVYDLDIRDSRVNAMYGLYELLGYEFAEAEHSLQWWDEQIHPEDLAQCHAALERMLDHPGDHVISYRVRHRGGDFLWVEDHATAVCDESGAVVRIVGAVIDISMRKRAEEALRDSEQKYRSLFENMSEMFQILEPIFGDDGRVIDFRYVEVNKATETLTGRSSEEIEGRTARELWGVVEDYWFEMLDKVVTSGEPVHVENYSQELDAYYDLRAWKADDGRVAMVFSNITAFRKAEAALRQSEERYRGIVETSSEGIVIADPMGHTLFANRRFAEMLGYGVEELVEGAHEPLVDPAFQAQVTEARERLRRGEVVREEIVLRRKDGSHMWTFYGATPLHDVDDKHIANLATHVDITEKKLLEEELVRQRRELEHLVQHATTGIYEIDFRGPRFLSVNDFMSTYSGYSREELLSMNVMDLLDPESRLRFEERIRRMLAGQPVDPMVEYRFLTKQGEVRWCVLNVAPTYEDGRPVGAFVVGQDVTERKRAEEALLEREAEKATLAERNRVARDLHDSVTQALFAANLKAEALTYVPDMDSRAAELVGDVHRLSRGALAQMRTLLLELRGEPIEDVPVRQLLTGLVDAAQARSSTAIDLELHGSPVLPPAVHTAVYRVAQEALNNVTKHAHATGAKLELLVQDHLVRLTVQDDGRGFDSCRLSPAHMGLRSMTERAAEIGALLTVESSLGGGTSVMLEWSGQARG